MANADFSKILSFFRNLVETWGSSTSYSLSVSMLKSHFHIEDDNVEQVIDIINHFDNSLILHKSGSSSSSCHIRYPKHTGTYPKWKLPGSIRLFESRRRN